MENILDDEMLDDDDHAPTNKHYYLGTYIGTDTQTHMDDYAHISHLTQYYVMGLRFPLNIFYEYSIDVIESSLEEYSYCEGMQKSLDIMQLIYKHSPELQWPIYTVLLKTHWLRLVQRTWKRVYKQKIAFMKNPKNIFNRGIGIRNNPPGLRGMLQDLQP